MGGSGGFFNNYKPEDVTKKIRESEEKTQNQEFETQVSQIIADLLKNFNNRNVEAINKHLETIKTALEKDIEGTLNLLFGGSVAKHTYVDGLSDIDSLVILNNSELKKLTPEEVKNYFYLKLKERLPQTSIEKGNLAVTVKFQDIEIQLLPAVKTESGIKIADYTAKSWSSIKPDKFTTELTQLNQQLGGKIVPTIKLAKSIISSFPNKKQLTGYHIETLASEVFQQYTGTFTTKAMIKYFFQEAPKLVLSPLIDKTGQSKHVDDYLGSSGSLERQIVADALDRVGRRLKNADGALSVNQWQQILGGK